MRRRRLALRLYGAPSDHERLDWAWVSDQLAGAGTYWLVAAGAGHPHPRPVWGVWQDDHLHLSVGSPVLRRAAQAGRAVTVHLDSGIDVVVVEGVVSAVPTATAAAVLAAYDAKYDWDYRVAENGELVLVRPATILAWRSAGWAGRDGFRATGRWVVDTAT